MTGHLARLEQIAQLSPAIADLTAIAVARIDRDGAVIEANRGFAYLLDVEHESTQGMNAAGAFINPTFEDLRRAVSPDDTLVYAGILTIGDPQRMTRSVHANVHQREGEIVVFAEHDIREIERLAATVIALNEELAQTQRDLVRANRSLKRKEEEIRRMMLTDVLTGIPNRRHFEEEAARAFGHMDRTGAPVCVAICDIDHFKAVNDTHGHDVGDEVLREVARRLQGNVRDADFAARWGGEEFVVLFADTTCDEASEVAERLRLAIGSAPIEALKRNVTISIGVAQCEPGQELDAALKRADTGLYEAKRNGRNQVVAC